MKYIKYIVLIAISFCFSFSSLAQKSTNAFSWPETPASDLFQDFLQAYNTGEIDEVRKFVRNHYGYNDSKKVDTQVEYWMDYYFRFGTLIPYEISINKPDDIEVWLQGETSKFWMAPEFILDKNTNKVRATGMLMGFQPRGVETPSKNTEEFISRLDDYLKEMEKTNLFQGVVLVQEGENVLIQQAYGLKDRYANERNSLSTRMRISSVTKMITGAAILSLVKDKTLSLEEPISTYLPDLPRQISDSVTIHHLLTHLSGIELDGIPEFRQEEKKARSIKEVYDLQLKYLPKWEKYQIYTVPDRFDYSNEEYNLLAIIIEKATGSTFEEYLKKHIFDKASMSATSFSKENLAVPYRYDIKENGLVSYEEHYGTDGPSGAGKLKSTATDLNNFWQTLLKTDHILDLPHKSLMFAPMEKRGGSSIFSGYGTVIDYEGVLSIGHNGTNIGNQAELRYFPKHDITLVALSNNRNGAHSVFAFVKNNLPEIE